MSNDRKFGAKVACFASNAAVQVEATQRHKDSLPIDDGQTVTIEMCPVINQRPDWKTKLGVQLSPDEIAIYSAVLLGFLPRCEFKRPDKGIYIERQKGKIYYKGSAGMGSLYQVPVGIGKTFNISQLVLKQICASMPETNSDFVLASIKGSSALYQL